MQILCAAPQKQEQNIRSQSTRRAQRELQEASLGWYKTQSVGYRAPSNQWQPWCFPEGSQLAAGSSPALLGSHPAICLGTASRTGYLPRFCLFGNRDGEESQWPWERLFQCCTWARLRAAPLWLTQSVSSPSFTQIPPFKPVKWVQPPRQKGGTFQLSGLPWSVYQI